MTTTGCRRTPGLRREEVAERASISVSWYTWLEQGRNIRVSDEVLESVADSLQLDHVQRRYVRDLARQAGGMAVTARHPAPGMLQWILDHHAPAPGYVIDARFTIVAWNRPALAVFGDFSRYDPEQRNIVRMMFGEQLRELIVNWEPNARFVLGAFRAVTSAVLGEQWFSRLVDDLTRTSAEFRAWWPEYNVELRPVALKEVAHPVVGRLRLEQTALALDHGSDSRMILYTPVPDTDTEQKLQRLAAGC